MKENRPCAFISSGQPQPKRAGPIISIRTSTFVELLGNAREWDAKFPALAGVSRAYLIESFTFDDAFCGYATEAERRRFAMEEVIRGRRLTRCGRVKRLILGALLFLALLSGTASAQDDFPPPGFFIPCCSSGGTGGHTGATYGENGQSAWKQVWGAAPGDVVTFRFVLRAKSAGSLHAWPQTTSGMGMQYIGDPNNVYEKWYWNTGQRSSGGTFCLDCPWQFVASDYNPWIYVAYFDSGDGWDIDLNVVDIRKPSSMSSWFRVLTDPDKPTAAAIGNALRGSAGGWAGFGLGIMPYSRTLGVTLAAMAYGADRLATIYHQWARDPWDGDYCTPVEWTGELDQQALDDLAWTWPYSGDSGTWLPYSAVLMITAGNLAQVAIDRAFSAAQAADWDPAAPDCAWQRRAEALSLINLTGEFMDYFEWSVRATADAHQGIIDPQLLWDNMYAHLDALAWIGSWRVQ